MMQVLMGRRDPGKQTRRCELNTEIRKDETLQSLSLALKVADLSWGQRMARTFLQGHSSRQDRVKHITSVGGTLREQSLMDDLLYVVCIALGQLLSKSTQWKIPERKNSYVLNCALFRVAC